MSWSGPQARDLLGELLAHAHARLVHGDVVDDRVRPREIHVLEDAGRVAPGRHALLRMHAAVHVDVNCLAGPDVALEREAQHVEGDALRREHPFEPARRLALAEHERADAVRVAKAGDAVPDDQHDDSIAAAAAPEHALDRPEHVGRCRFRTQSNAAARLRKR